MDVTTELVGTVHIVRASGRLDSGTAEAFDARMQDVINTPDPRLVLDFSQLVYVSSMGLRSLLALAKKAHALGGALVLAAVQPRVQDILEIAGFTTMFAIVPTTEAALAQLQPDR
jgi:anti-anti-sigma factor